MKRYIRTWQMEPIPAAMIAALAPPDIETRFYDDRLEPIPFDEPTDLVAISVETYTAKRAYQIASEYRRRGVPVVMGGFHATLCPEEVMQYCESIVIGEAETLFPTVIDDYRHGQAEKVYRSSAAAGAADYARPLDLSWQTISSRSIGRVCPRLSIQVRLLRGAVVFRCDAQSSPDRPRR